MLRSSLKRAPARPPDLRTAILDAARALCLADGAAGISARKIAARVGCSATTIYLYYRNLDDLLHQLRMEGHARLAERLRATPLGASAGERVRAMGRAYYRFGVDNPHQYDLMFSFAAAHAPRRDVVQREMYTLMLLRDEVTRGIVSGEFRDDCDPMIVTNALWSQVHGVTALAVSGMLMQTAAGEHAQVLEAILDGAVRWLAAPAATAVDGVTQRGR